MCSGGREERGERGEKGRTRRQGVLCIRMGSFMECKRVLGVRCSSVASRPLDARCSALLLLARCCPENTTPLQQHNATAALCTQHHIMEAMDIDEAIRRLRLRGREQLHGLEISQVSSSVWVA